MKRFVYIMIAILTIASTSLGAIEMVGSSETSPLGDSMRSYYGEAPTIKGPYEDGCTPTELKLGEPDEDCLTPDDQLKFVSVTPPQDVREKMESDTGEGSGSWYWPGAVTTKNLLYVQTSKGLTTVAGCSYEGHLALWAKVAQTGNFFVYEWYPDKLSPSVNWLSWIWPGYMKGWFKGDTPGWHIICYHCGQSSNYVYIYVWPHYGSGGSQKKACTTPSATSSTEGSICTDSGAPTPPDPLSEGMMPTDLRLTAPEYTYPSWYSDLSSYSGGSYSPPSGGGLMPPSASSGYDGCVGYGSSYPGSITPPGYGSQTATVSDFGLVYTPMSSCKYNEYYIQTYPNKLTTVGSTRPGEWVALWSKINRAGTYWSFEWPPREMGYYCKPEVKNFGCKNPGWYPTWFRSNKAGWHLLCYQCGDWSNYIYIYVWPQC